MIAELLGSGDASAAIRANGNAVATVIGSAALVAAARATAGMSADISVTGEFLTPASIAQSVKDVLRPDLETINTGVRRASLMIPHSGTLP
jgi:predicted RecA/RadA family phage recombinase